MKKIIAIILALTCLLGVVGCGKTNDNKMYIEPAQLSKEEENIGKLLGLDTDHIIYDFTLEDGIQTMEVNTYILIDGEWDMISGGGQVFEDTTGRIALGYDKIAEGVRVAIQSDNENDATSYIPTTDEDFSKITIGTTKLNNRTKISFDEEIPVVLQIMTTKNGIRNQPIIEQFFEPNTLEEYEYVYAITVRFSQKSVSELDAERIR